MMRGPCFKKYNKKFTLPLSNETHTQHMAYVGLPPHTKKPAQNIDIQGR